MSNAYHPQTNGQEEVTNRPLKRILERTVSHHGKVGRETRRCSMGIFYCLQKPTWHYTIPNDLWQSMSTFNRIIVQSSLGIETCNLNPSETGIHRKMQINVHEELRDQSTETSYIYKERTKLLHDAKLIPTTFAPGDKILLFNLRFKRFSGKFKSRWSRPFTVIHVFPHGVVELEGTFGNFKVNGHLQKVYLEDHTMKEDPLSLDPP
ncbi:uncharacterized protein [Rutidosis leptorrhynchoides]|uniref:uncharacterized protein n=1 Tax=Rutidosis leptorrhynchoides TaxID=125765 RepID=UPI003A99212D